MGLDPTIVTAIGPSIGVVVVVWFFLNYMRVARRSQDKIEDHRIEQLKQIGADCHEHTTALNVHFGRAVDRSSEALDRNSEILGQSLEALRRMNHRS